MRTTLPADCDPAKQPAQPAESGLTADAPFDYTAHWGQLRTGIDPRSLNALAWQEDDER